jgi:hypothetical protein
MAQCKTNPHTGSRSQVVIGLRLELTISMGKQKHRVQGSCHLGGCSFQQENLN